MNPPNRSLVYRVSRNGHVMGEYDIDRIVELLDSGEFLWTDLCWTQGMAGWGPLSGLRSEVAAAKAFPPVAAMSMPVASGRRRMQVPPSQVSMPQPSPSGGAGWWWIVGGVMLGALVGLLTTYLFPTVVNVDRAVEKIVEKPVEVLRTVEKRVEVPAALTPAQVEAIDYAKARDDAFLREVGVGRTALIPVIDKKLKVFISIDDGLKPAIAEDSIRARIEAVFRRNGFEVVSPAEDSVFCNTLVFAEIFRAEDKTPDHIAGVIRLKVNQYFILSGANIQKLAWLDAMSYESALSYGSQAYYKIPSHFEDFAVQASNDLLKAGKLPLRKDAK